jgi:hypothetical protein
MKIRIVASSDREVYLGVDSDGNFCVLSLDDGSYNAELGDVLSGTFDDSNGLFKDVYDVTRDRKIGMCAEDWECSLDVALGHLIRIASPDVLYAGSKRFSSGEPNIMEKLRNEISQK